MTFRIKAPLFINSGLFVVLAAVPIVAEYVTAEPGNVPGTGFDVLCYKPFDFAYILFASALFLVANVAVALRGDQSLKNALLVTTCIAPFWLFTSFVLVASVHNALGGTL